MNWQAKAFIQAALSRLPYHQHLYRWLHSTFGSASRTLGDQLERKIVLINRMRSNGLAIEEKVVLEIGTGWHPVMPLLLSLMGAKRIITVDTNPWLTRRTLAVTVTDIERDIERVAEALSIPISTARDRLKHVSQSLADPSLSSVQILDRCRIEYRMPCDAAATGLPDHSIDYIISANVLEHVPKPIIASLFTEARRLLASDGTMYHHVNPGDHFSQDTRISSANFLKYSSSRWYYIGGSGVAYHNRLRCIDYVRLVEDAKFTIVNSYTNTDARPLALLKEGTLRVHPDYQAYTPEQLACDIIGLFAVPSPDRVIGPP